MKGDLKAIEILLFHFFPKSLFECEQVFFTLAEEMTTFYLELFALLLKNLQNNFVFDYLANIRCVNSEK